MTQKIALLWQAANLGLYSNRTFAALFKDIGQNNGNLAFVYAIASQLEGDITILPWHANPDILNTFDAVVIPCANQFGNHTDLGGLAPYFEMIEKPMIAIGLGAQAESMDHDVTPTEGTVRWIKAIDSRRYGSASNIYTRGPYSSRQLARYDFSDTVVGGCPTHFISTNPKLGAAIQADWDSIPVPRSLSVCAGHEGWLSVTKVEHQLIALMMDPVAIGQYVVQSMGEMIKISRGLFDDVDPEILEAIRVYTVPHYTMDEFKAWCRNYARSFYDVPAWMDSLARYDLTIGARYHGTQLAIQAEKMGCVVATDSRTEEMCHQTGVPVLTLAELENEPITRARLKKLIRFDGETYDAFRAERAQNYVTFLENNGLTPKPFLKEIAGA